MSSAPINGSIFSLRSIRSVPLRAALAWLAVRAFLAGSTILAGAGPGFGSLGFKGTIYLACIVGVVVFLDSRRRREAEFLSNLGVPALVLPLTGAATVVVLEVLTSIAVSFARTVG